MTFRREVATDIRYPFWARYEFFYWGRNGVDIDRELTPPVEASFHFGETIDFHMKINNKERPPRSKYLPYGFVRMANSIENEKN
jgi:hypothetical protein